MVDSKGWRIAKIRGVDVKVHYSLLLLLPYLVLITAARFHAVAHDVGINPASLSFGPIVWGLILTLSLLGSVILHELGHSRAAQILGVRVRSITLMMLGGVSSIEKVPDRPYGEFKIAIVGPLVSFGIAGLMYGVEKLAHSPDLVFFSHWVSRINVILGVFNMLPAFPLDGGRALRSLLAVKRGQTQATEIAVKVSTGFAWALGFIAVFGFNVILLLVAFFIASAARREYAKLISKDLLRGLHASEVAVLTPVLNERQYIHESASSMIDSGQSVLPVARDNGEAAIISLAQIRCIPREYWDTTTVKDLMVHVAMTLNTNDLIRENIPALATAPMGVLPVQENNVIFGIIRYSDLSELVELSSLDEKKRVA